MTRMNYLAEHDSIESFLFLFNSYVLRMRLLFCVYAKIGNLKISSQLKLIYFYELV